MQALSLDARRLISAGVGSPWKVLFFEGFVLVDGRATFEARGGRGTDVVELDADGADCSGGRGSSAGIFSS